MTARLEVLIAPPDLQPLYQLLVFKFIPLNVILKQYEPSHAQLLQVQRCLKADCALFKRAADSVQFDPPARARPKLPKDYSATLADAMIRWVYRQEPIDDAINAKGMNADKDPKHRRYLVMMVRDLAVRLANISADLGVMLAPLQKRQLHNTYGLNPDTIEDDAERKRLARNDNHVRKLLGRPRMQARTITWRYNLTVEDAFKILGRDSVGRPVRG